MNRLDRIYQLKADVFPLRSARIFNLAKIGILKDIGGPQEEIAQAKSALIEIDAELRPMLVELESLQCQYFISYDIESTNIYGTKEYLTQRRYLYLDADFYIDTFTDGWTIDILRNPGFTTLYLELNQEYLSKVSGYRDLQIKRML